MKQTRRNVNPSIYLADSLEITNLEKICSHLSRKRAKRRFLFFVSFSWFCFVLFSFFFRSKSDKEEKKKKQWSQSQILYYFGDIILAEEELSEGRGLFIGNVRFQKFGQIQKCETDIESFFPFFHPCIISIIILSFQASFCVEILRSRCFLQPSI